MQWSILQPPNILGIATALHPPEWPVPTASLPSFIYITRVHRPGPEKALKNRCSWTFLLKKVTKSICGKVHFNGKLKEGPTFFSERSFTMKEKINLICLIKNVKYLWKGKDWKSKLPYYWKAHPKPSSSNLWHLKQTFSQFSFLYSSMSIIKLSYLL